MPCTITYLFINVSKELTPAPTYTTAILVILVILFSSFSTELITFSLTAADGKDEVRGVQPNLVAYVRKLSAESNTSPASSLSSLEVIHHTQLGGT